MGSRGSVAATMVLCCLALSAVTVAAAEGSGFRLAQRSIDADTVSLRVNLQSDATAAWRVTYRMALTDANETDAFRGLRDDIQADARPYIDRFADRMRRAARTAENSTGRSMAIQNVTVEAGLRSLPQGTFGVITFQFAWTNFAAIDGDQLRAGDAIDELFLDASTSLSVAWPASYHLVSHGPDASNVDNGSVTWQGRRDFGPGEPRVVVAPGPAGTTDGGDVTPTMLAILGTLGLAALSLLVAVGLWLAGQRGRPGSADGPDGMADGDAKTDEAPPDELLSNEERVLRVLEDHGGRIKQARVAEELDWTAAKTSQVVSDLRDSDRLESFRLGRENVLTLPDISIEPGADEEER